MKQQIYRGRKTKEISFPVGGIGSGCIGIAGNGRLIDWEIFNRPNKGSMNGFSHFAVKAEAGGRVLDARALHGDLQPPYSGDYNKPHFQSYGFGPQRYTMAGVPHFREVEFCGEYPFATLKFMEECFPGDIEMTVFNPLIPVNDKDSSIPAAFFDINIKNTQSIPIDYSVAFSVGNPVKDAAHINTYEESECMHLLHIGSDRSDRNRLDYGDLCIASDTEAVSYQEYWYRGGWFDGLGVFWNEFTSPGRLKNRSYPPVIVKPTVLGDEEVSTLVAHVTIQPGEEKKTRFLLSWNFPNCTNYWNPPKCDEGVSQCDCSSKPQTWKNYYSTLFESSRDSAKYGLKNWERLYEDTSLFKDTLFSSTLPDCVLDAVSANISILKSPTCLRLKDGSFYGFEGCHCDAGCCEGSCTHVWNYAYALPFLFPGLERSMRDLDYKYNPREDGGMCFRLQLPIGREPNKFRACVDGQLGGVIKAYRDWKISGDTEWLKTNWTSIKRSIEFAWSESNVDGWDADRDGVLEGRQHHTLDMELFGPNSWLTGFYLGALKAGAEMAEHLGETEKSAEYRELFMKGKEWMEKHLFNGEYYHQFVDFKDKSVVEQYDINPGDKAVETYWNEEAEQIKYQIGEGCIIDQVVAQWHANLCGLGEIFDKSRTKKALKSIYRYNFKRSFRNHFNPCRIYTLNDEGGVVICEWPSGKEKPLIPVPYSEETFYGLEYQAAAHMIQEGLVEEGLEIVSSVRRKFDGENRNPWNEFECGSNYARSMASYSLLNAFSGFEYDMVKGMMGFRPVMAENGVFKTFWSLDSGWGEFSMQPGMIEIKVLYGELRIKTLKLDLKEKTTVFSVQAGGIGTGFLQSDSGIEFDIRVSITPGNSLVVRL